MAKEKNKRIKILNAIANIRRNYPKIKTDDITFAALVFYPVALVEVTAQERSVEDFDAVQLLVLRFFELRINITDISALTGLNVEYVERIARLLMGYGYIDESGNITELGKESIQEERKILQKESKRHIQLDALSLSLIPYDLSVDEFALYEKPEAGDEKLWKIGVISYPEGITADNLNKQIEQCDYQRIIGADGIHVNIETITDMRCLKIHYALSCMLCLRGGDEPIVFAKRRIQDKSYSQWSPLAFVEDYMCLKYELPEMKVDNKRDVKKHLHAMKSLLDSKWGKNISKILREENPQTADNKQSTYFPEEVEYAESKSMQNTLCKFYPFDLTKGNWQYSNGQGHLSVNSDAFTEYKNFSAISRIMMDFVNDGKFLFADEYLFGRLVTIAPQTEDSLLLEVINLLQMTVYKYRDKSRAVDNYLKSYFNNKKMLETNANNGTGTETLIEAVNPAGNAMTDFTSASSNILGNLHKVLTNILHNPDLMDA